MGLVSALELEVFTLESLQFLALTGGQAYLGAVDEAVARLGAVEEDLRASAIAGRSSAKLQVLLDVGAVVEHLSPAVCVGRR